MKHLYSIPRVNAQLLNSAASLAFCVALIGQTSLIGVRFWPTCGNQAIILATWERLEEALALYRKKESICLKVGNRGSLANGYRNWGLRAFAQGDHTAAKEKLGQALAIFTELKMPRERDAVQKDLEKMGAE